jgi:hypothetical protein
VVCERYIAGDRIIGARMIFGWVIQYDLAHYSTGRHGSGSPEVWKVVTPKEQSNGIAWKVVE